MKKGTRIAVILLSVLLLLALAAGACFGVCRYLLGKRLEGCRILEAFARQAEMELQAQVTADFAGASFSGEASLFRRETEDGSFSGIMLDGQTLYLHDAVFYLPNGRAFRISAQLPQGDALLEQARLVLSASKVTREQTGTLTVYRAEAEIDQAKAILKYLSPETAEKMSVIDSLTITLTAEEQTLRGLTVTAAGSDGTNPYSLCLTLTVLSPGTLNTAIPQAVLDAVKNPGEILTLRWNPDALPLLRGVMALASRNDFQAELELKLESGILSLSKSMDVRYNAGIRPGIGRLAGSGLEFYFSGSRLCTAKGQLLTEYENLRFDRLPALALPVLVEGKVESLRTGDSGLYTMPLTREELDIIASFIPAQAIGLTVRLTDGSLEARVTDNHLTAVSFTCGGLVSIFRSEVPAELTVILRPAENPQTFAVPDAVRAALSGQ